MKKHDTDHLKLPRLQPVIRLQARGAGDGGGGRQRSGRTCAQGQRTKPRHGGREPKNSINTLARGRRGTCHPQKSPRPSVKRTQKHTVRPIMNVIRLKNTWCRSSHRRVQENTNCGSTHFMEPAQECTKVCGSTWRKRQAFSEPTRTSGSTKEVTRSVHTYNLHETSG